MAKLPADEHKAWSTLWAEVDSLLKGEAASRSQGTKPDGSGKVQAPQGPAEPKPSGARLEPGAPAVPKPDVKPDNAEALAGIHKRAHELAQSKPSEAEPLFRQALEGYRKTQGPDGFLILDLTLDLANLLDQSGRGAEAEPLIASGCEGMKAREAKIPPPAKPRLTDAAERVVKLYEAWGKKDEAARWRAKLSKPSEQPKPQP